MSFTTVAFFVFLLAGIVVYYVLPKNVQWIWLLILSYIYYIFRRHLASKYTEYR